MWLILRRTSDPPKTEATRHPGTTTPGFHPTPRGFLEEAFSAHPGLSGQPLKLCRQHPPLAWSALGSLKAPSQLIYIPPPNYSSEISSSPLSLFDAGAAWHAVRRAVPNGSGFHSRLVRAFSFSSSGELLSHRAGIKRRRCYSNARMDYLSYWI